MSEQRAQLPPKIKIGPINFRIVTDLRSLQARRREQNTPWLAGCVSYAEEQITLDPDVSTEATLANVLHETLHVCLEQKGIEPTEQGLIHITEESLVTALGYSLATWLIDNPALVAWVQKQFHNQVWYNQSKKYEGEG